MAYVVYVHCLLFCTYDETLIQLKLNGNVKKCTLLL